MSQCMGYSLDLKLEFINKFYLYKGLGHYLELMGSNVKGNLKFSIDRNEIELMNLF